MRSALLDSPLSSHLDNSVGSASPMTPSNQFSSLPASPSRSKTGTSFTGPSPSAQDFSSQDPLEILARVKETQSAPSGFLHLDKRYASELGSDSIARSFNWEIVDEQGTMRRRLGPTESSYYLGSRGIGIEGGVNDMYLHIGFRAPSRFVSEERVLRVWTELLRQHTLLRSSVVFEDYYNVHFVSRTSGDQNQLASFAHTIDRYLNGERTLSDEKLATLVISTPEESLSCSGEKQQEYNFFLYSTHFIGDGMALHTTANDFFRLLAKDAPSDSVQPVAEPPINLEILPQALERSIKTPTSWGKLAWTAAQVDFDRGEAKNLGGQAFSRAPLGPRQTVVPTKTFSRAESHEILATCKSHSSTIASALFALTNLAYLRSIPTDRLDPRLPLNLYSAQNIRGSLQKEQGQDEYHLAIGYYNIILPAFYPNSIPVSDYLWLQALSVKRQTAKIVKSPFLTSRTILKTIERETRSIGFERADAKKRESTVECTKGLETSAERRDSKVEEMETETREGVIQPTRVVPNEPAVANISLMGLSMLGNLDAIYQHAEYSKSGIELHTLTTGSRQRPGAILLFSYTFAGKLAISLGYDRNGFERGTIERWWQELLKAVDELLLERKMQ
ncbi:uncharacterized protein JCM15063_003169 [Sporobolomyces koalae]|uniref:uncharacterized protein n=1 Tax=Sporobolomyces koalae TaxID=500713 RepID=UPI00317DE892